MWFCWEPQGTKGNPWVLICTKKIQNPSRNGWVIAVFHQEVCDSIEKHIGLKGMPGCYVIVPNRSKISQEKADLLQFSTKVVLFHWEPHRTKKEPLVLICTKKILSYGHFPRERLHNSIENHEGQKGSLDINLYKKHPISVKIWPFFP